MDEIFGDLGDDALHGGDGDDTIHGGGGADLIHGDGGADELFGDSGADELHGDLGADTLRGGFGEDLLIGGFGDDRLFGEEGSDVLWGGLDKRPVGDFNLNRAANFRNPIGFDEAELAHPTGFTPPRITPVTVALESVEGDLADGEDTLEGGTGIDFLFGGGDRDTLRGGDDSDYLDGGLEMDDVFGGAGDDVARGGAGDDVLHGDTGIDQLYGDDGSDFLFGDAGRADDAGRGGDAGAPEGSQAGQRLHGGAGIDFLYAYAGAGITETSLAGDELHGGAGGDWLWGNLRQDILIGDGGNDYLHGDFLSGPDYLDNMLADQVGGSDQLFGGSGEDQLFGGGSDDILWGGADTDWLEGQKGDDTLYGGSAIDLLVLDTRPEYFDEGAPAPNDIFDGHFGNALEGDVLDDNATDIMLVRGTSAGDRIRIGQTADGRSDGRPRGQLYVDFNGHDIFAPWRSAPTAGNPLGVPLVEQIRVSGLVGDDDIAFLDLSAPGVEPLDIGDLNARSDDYVGVIDGGPGNDILRGTAGRDRLDGGFGSDTLYGLAGDDRLWGDTGEGFDIDHDVLFAGQGNDDLIGGQGTNELYAWSADPNPIVTQLHFAAGQPAAATLTGRAPAPKDGRLRADMTFSLRVDGAASVDFTILAQDTAANSTPAQLVAQIQAAIDASALAGTVT
ncbi:MAG TPA: calcium-binding protein, partial [Rhodospirillales bacterium]